MDTHPQQASLDLVARADLLEVAVIRSAATLGIADTLVDGPATAREIATSAASDPDVTAYLLDEMVSRGLLTIERSGGGSADEALYGLTDAAQPLRSDHPLSVRPMLRNDTMLGVSGLSMMRLDHTVRTGEPSALASGVSFWQQINVDPVFLPDWQEQAEAADQQGGALGWGASLIIDGYDWSNVGHVVDVGGHVGSISLALLAAHPDLRATLLDFGHPATVSRERFERAGMADRATVVDGDFFAELPAGGDVYLVSAILADWPDEDAVRILKRCREAAAATGGRVLLAEVGMPMDSASTRLRMRSMMPSPDRSSDELKALARAAGLDVRWESPAHPVRTLFELVPA